MAIISKFCTAWPITVIDRAKTPNIGAINLVALEYIKHDVSKGILEIRMYSTKFASLPQGYVIQ